MSLYPIPTMPSYTGNASRALAILERVDLDRERFLCLAVWDADSALQISQRQHADGITVVGMSEEAQNLRDWIDEALGEHQTYDDWLEAAIGQQSCLTHRKRCCPLVRLGLLR